MCHRLLANPVIEAYEVDVGVRRRDGDAIDVRRSASSSSRARTASSTCAWAVEQLGGRRRAVLARATPTPRGVDAVVVPGGFAHGDYLRTGAIARFSPVMDAVGRARRGRRPGRRHLQRLPGAHRGAACCPARCRRTPG